MIGASGDLGGDAARGVPGPRREGRPSSRPLRRRHVLMLALAAEVLVLGLRGAEGYRPPGIAVEQTVAAGHIIT